MKRPNFFYRYRSLAGNGLAYLCDSLRSGKHYFARPSDFNDPMECWPSVSFVGTDKDLAEYYEKIIDHFPAGAVRTKKLEEIAEILGDPARDLRIQENKDVYREELKVELDWLSRILCLSVEPDDLLMWAHYADSHHGVCLVFDGQSKFVTDALPVNYLIARPVLRPFKDSLDAMMTKSLFVKSVHWRYEKEWRINETSIGLPAYRDMKNALVAVILGARISEANRAAVIQCLKELQPRPKLKQASVAKSRFAMRISNVFVDET